MRRRVLERASKLMLAIAISMGLATAFLLFSYVRTGHLIPPSQLFKRPSPKPIGILAGHWQSDAGAVCEDGVREVDVNLEIAKRVVKILEKRGYRVEMLAEFDPALSGYLAEVLVALHADSCIPGLTGFKIARAANSALPEEEDRLVECLYAEYERATGLPRHEGSITPDMRFYHAFGEIAPPTPGAIIETGFLWEDRDILIKNPERAAQGIANGILCFLESSPTP